MQAIELDAVTKSFGGKVAVDALTLSVPAGSFLGLLGRNGAGKSTTIKLITGLLRPTSGRVRVLGLDLDADPIAVKRQIGVMPEDTGLLDRLTGRQYLEFVGRMYGLPDAEIRRRQEELFETLDLSAGPRTLLCDYSYGMRKKVALSAALIHAPRLVLLDEPFEGIDPLTGKTIKEILLSLRKKGVTVLLTSHILEIVEKLCPTVAIIDSGRLMGFGTLEELRERQGGEAKSLEEIFLGLMGGARTGELSFL